ncbi:MAG TPA: glycerophosphodiester phosphodiesterase family protein [Microthrixaceae bacterium]|nr:glycerophosphodiester phosphodiesterase family protein [Microthrixaceae bacterium]
MDGGRVLRTVVLGVIAASSLAAPGAGAQPTVPSDSAPVLVVAHRGASKDAPEHTGHAYDRAVWAGADILECDLQLTSDERIVCVHDTTVDRTTGGAHTGRVDAYTLDQLRQMDFGSWFGPAFAGARVVTLEEQLECYRQVEPPLQFYLETKAPAEYGGRMEPLLVDLLERLDLVPDDGPDPRTSPVIVQSFDAQSLAAVGALAPSLPRALLTVTEPTEDALTTATPDVEAPSADVLATSSATIARAHDLGREVHTWTVDDPAEIQTLVGAGIDGFFTNDPATARTVVDDLGRGSGREAIEAPETSPQLDGCAGGMGAGLAVTTTTTTTAVDDAEVAGEDDEDDEGPVLVYVAIGLAALVIVIAGAVAFRRAGRD